MNLVHVHLILNHVPIVGTVFAGILLAIAIRWRNSVLERTALAFLVGLALLTIPLYLTGEPAEHRIERLPGIVKSVIERHEDAAQASLVAVEILGAAALVGLAVFGRTALPRAFAVALLTLTIVTTGFFGWTGYLGGQIRHPEIAAGSSATAPPGAESKRHGRDDD